MYDGRKLPAKEGSNEGCLIFTNFMDYQKWTFG